MIGGPDETARYSAVLAKDKKYDGIFYFAVKNTGVYCRPSCPVLRRTEDDYVFFDSVAEAEAGDCRPCMHCRPDRLGDNLSHAVLASIDAGKINDEGVHGLADSLHMSERHLRRIVQERTGRSPSQLNEAKRLKLAKELILHSELSIVDVAFSAGFSSLRQFNSVFKRAFETTPRTMRRVATFIPQKDHAARALRLPHSAFLRLPLELSLTKTNKRLGGI